MSKRLFQPGLWALLLLALVPAARAATDCTQVAKLSGDVQFLARFGKAAAIDGDTVVVGAPGEDHSGIADAGAAYVFVWSGTAWSREAKLTAPDAGFRDAFGGFVDIDGDTIVVGAIANDHGGLVNAGAAYVFVRSGTTWSLQQKLTASDEATVPDEVRFGAVALDGDTLVVGAPGGKVGDQAGLQAKGAVYVYVRSGTTWSEQAKLEASDGAAGDAFGTITAIHGDTLVASAPLDDHSGVTDPGSAYVFVRNGTTWTEQAKLVAPDAATEDSFAWLGIHGDTIVATAQADDHSGLSNAGSAYVFVRSGATWSLQQKLTASDAAAGDLFGAATAIEGDTIVLGAPGDALGHGSVYEFTRSGTTWTEIGKFTCSGFQRSGFGIGLDLSGTRRVAGEVLSESSYVFECVSANDAPTADAGPDQAISAGTTVHLDGTGSFDDNTPAADLGYAWSFVSVPAGSAAVLVDADTDVPSFLADKAGTYEVRLVVTDEEGLDSAPDTVRVASVNVPPTADAGMDVVVGVGDPALLDGSGSSDPNGDALTYAWTIASAPGGSTAALSNPASATPTLTPDVEGTYVLRLVVNDGSDDSAPDFAEVVAIGPQFALQRLACAATYIADMPAGSFQAPGHRRSLVNEINRIIRFIQRDDIAQAEKHLVGLLERTDGCALRGSPDPMGGGTPYAGDHIVDCDDQAVVHTCLSDALSAIA